jgi:hypothetical protein
MPIDAKSSSGDKRTKMESTRSRSVGDQSASHSVHEIFNLFQCNYLKIREKSSEDNRITVNGAT